MSCWKKKKKLTPSFIRIIYWWSSCQVPSLPTYKKAYLNLIFFFFFDFISRIITVQPNLCERYLCSNRSINISTLVLWFSSFFAFLSFFFNFFFSETCQPSQSSAARKFRYRTREGVDMPRANYWMKNPGNVRIITKQLPNCPRIISMMSRRKKKINQISYW